MSRSLGEGRAQDDEPTNQRARPVGPPPGADRHPGARPVVATGQADHARQQESGPTEVDGERHAGEGRRGAHESADDRSHAERPVTVGHQTPPRLAVSGGRRLGVDRDVPQAAARTGEQQPGEQRPGSLGGADHQQAPARGPPTQSHASPHPERTHERAGGQQRADASERHGQQGDTELAGRHAGPVADLRKP
jgi:hypothetical protein